MLTFPKNLTVPQKQAFEKRYRQAAAEYIPRRVAYFQPFTGGTYTRITIRGQHTRWGSCSSQGTLSFNWRLMLAPPRVLDYVVVPSRITSLTSALFCSRNSFRISFLIQLFCASWTAVSMASPCFWFSLTSFIK